MANLINKKDSLNDGRIKINESIEQSERAETKSDDAVQTANTAKQTAESTKAEFDQVVIDGDSSVEAAQARVDADGESHATLKDRLDVEHNEVTSQLAQTAMILESQLVNAKYPPAPVIGAKGDGVADDTDALIGLINYCYNNDKSLFIPSGSYNFSNLNVSGGVKLFGEGRQRTFLNHIGSGVAIKNNNRGNITDLTLHINSNTELGVDMSGSALSALNAFEIFGEGLGDGIKIANGDTSSSYYMSLYDVYIRNTQRGFVFGTSANSNRLFGCRTSNVDVPVDMVGNDINNVLFLSCAFEGYSVGLKLKGTNNLVLACRFENPTKTGSNGIGVQIVGGYRNYIISPHFQGNLQNIEDISEYKDTVILDNTLSLGNKSLLDVSGISLTPQSTASNANKGRLTYLKETASGSDGLYMYDTSWRKIQNVHFYASHARPSSPRSGEMIFDSTLKKPIWFDGAQWVDSTGVNV